jgi:putative ABC transport system permease protein
MLKVAFKSLLDRKLRLLLSTSAIVLGVGFVVGSLVFTDMLQAGFDKIFSRAVGDVVVRDRAGVGEFGTPTDKTVPASPTWLDCPASRGRTAMSPTRRRS